MDAKTITYLPDSICDLPTERTEVTDGEIVISYNSTHSASQVWWSWLEHDDAENQDDGQRHWRHVPLQSADLPVDGEAALAMVRLHADIDD